MAEKTDQFKELGATLVALSPELPDASSKTIKENELDFAVLTDRNLEVADDYGLVFRLQYLKEIYERRRTLSDFNGEENEDKLPLSATYVIDQDGIIQYAFVDVNYRYRAEPTRIVDALKHLAGEGSSEHLVLQLWENTWNPPYDLNLIDRLMPKDFTITSGGKDIVGRDQFKERVVAFQKQVANLRVESKDTFANTDGTKVTSRFVVSGHNKGLFDLPADEKPVDFTGIAVWELRDGKLTHSWVERSALELYQKLSE